MKTTIRRCRECGVYELPNGVWGDESSIGFVEKHKELYDVKEAYCPECKIGILERNGFETDNRGRVVGVRR